MVDKSEKFRWLVRLGFAARGLVYLLIGYLALTATREVGPEGAFDLMQDAPLGPPILYLAVLGLVAYALFRFASLLFDIENHGSAAKGILHRLGHGASAIAHLALAWTAFKFARGEEQAASGGAAHEAAGTLLSFPFGPLVLGVAGLGFAAAAVLQAKSAVSAGFTRHIAADAPAIVKPLGRAGHAARAVVFLIIGWSLVKSAWFSDTDEVKSLGEAVGSLADNGTLYTLVAAGLLLFGLFSLLLARYRIVPDLTRSDLKPTLH
jgi:hypothetical protein